MSPSHLAITLALGTSAYALIAGMVWARIRARVDDIGLAICWPLVLTGELIRRPVYALWCLGVRIASPRKSIPKARIVND